MEITLVHMSQLRDGIGTAAADSIGYRLPAQYRSNPSSNSLLCLLPETDAY